MENNLVAEHFEILRLKFNFSFVFDVFNNEYVSDERKI